MDEIRLCDCPVIEENESAALLDLGDGVACLEFRTKGHAVSFRVADLFRRVLDHTMRNFCGLVVGNQGKNFSVGADLNVTRDDILAKRFDEFYENVKTFQLFNQSLKTYPKPIVCAPYRRTLGGGLETAMHCHARVARADTMAGLVETGVGVIPGGGGIKEALVNATALPQMENSVRTIFLSLIFAKTSADAANAVDMHYLRPDDEIVPMDAPLLAAAKAKCLSLADRGGFTKQAGQIRYLGAPGYRRLLSLAEELREEGALTPFSYEIAVIVAEVLTGGDACPRETMVPEETVWEYERQGFSALVRHPRTLERIEHVLATGELLRN